MKPMEDNKTISGCNIGRLFAEMHILAEEFPALIALYDEGKIKPYVDKAFAFSEAAAAHHYIHDRKAKGKVLLVPDERAA